MYQEHRLPVVTAQLEAEVPMSSDEDANARARDCLGEKQLSRSPSGGLV